MVEPTRVVQLENMVRDEDLQDPNELAEIGEDVQSECGKFGVVSEVRVPQAGAPGAGRVYVMFEDTSMASAALAGMHGRGFAGALVQATFFPLDKFEAGVLPA